MSGTFVTVTTLLYGLVGLKKVRPIKDDIHAPMGVTVTMIILILGATGILTRSRLNRAVKGQNSV